MKLQQELQAMFPEAPEDDIVKVVVTSLLPLHEPMNPAIVAPNAFDVVDVGMDNQLSGGCGGGVDCALNNIK